MKNQKIQHQNLWVFSMRANHNSVLIDNQFYNLFLHNPRWALDMFLSLSAIGWARHDVDVSAMGWVPIKNQTLCSLLNSLPTKNIWYATISLHVQCPLLPVRAEINWVVCQNKIYQT